METFTSDNQLERPEPLADEPLSFKPGGVLENLGGMLARFGNVEVQIISSPDDPTIGFITGLKGKNTASVISEISDAIHKAGFKSVEYRPDNEDGRAAARMRLFESLKKKIHQ